MSHGRLDEGAQARTGDQDREALLRQVEMGIAAATDAANEAAMRVGGKATTNLSSPWLCDGCPVCRHTFRVGDRVAIDEHGIVRHSSSALPCTQEQRVEAEYDPEVESFFAGLDDAWPPPADVPVLRLDVGHELLAPPLAGFKRHTCVVCGHTFRRHDFVVICPCYPDAPRCQAAVHRDVVHGLFCFDSWNPAANNQKFCPVTMRELDD